MLLLTHWEEGACGIEGAGSYISTLAGFLPVIRPALEGEQLGPAA